MPLAEGYGGPQGPNSHVQFLCGADIECWELGRVGHNTKEVRVSLQVHVFVNYVPSSVSVRLITSSNAHVSTSIHVHWSPLVWNLVGIQTRP